MLWINLIKLYGFDEELYVYDKKWWFLAIMMIDLRKKWTVLILYGQMKIEFQKLIDIVWHDSLPVYEKKLICTFYR